MHFYCSNLSLRSSILNQLSVDIGNYNISSKNHFEFVFAFEGMKHEKQKFKQGDLLRLSFHSTGIADFVARADLGSTAAGSCAYTPFRPHTVSLILTAVLGLRLRFVSAGVSASSATDASWTSLTASSPSFPHCPFSSADQAVLHRAYVLNQIKNERMYTLSHDCISRNLRAVASSLARWGSCFVGIGS